MYIYAYIRTYIHTHTHTHTQGSGHDKFLNCAELNERPNFLALLVSATPYNVLTNRSRIPAKYFRAEDGLESAIDLHEWKAKSAEQQRNYEEVHIVRWFERDEKASGPYFRLEDFLHTVQSELRHVAAGESALFRLLLFDALWGFARARSLRACVCMHVVF